jgi:dienelactone hydrolase
MAMQFPADATSAQPTATFDEFASLDAVLDDVTRRHTIDDDRIYLAGISHGANRAWQYACRHPGRFAGLLSMAAGPISKEEACNLGDLPIWAFQSAHDRPTPVGQLQELVGRENSQDPIVTVTVVNSAAHDCWTLALTKFRAWRWLLDQRRGQRVRRFGQSLAGQYLSRSQALGTSVVLGIGSIWFAATAIRRLARGRGYRWRCEFQRARDDAG